jgi:hypothetical protein
LLLMKGKLTIGKVKSSHRVFRRVLFLIFLRCRFQVKVITKLPNSEQSYKGTLYQVRVITVFTVFRLLTDFVCLYNYEFGLSLCKIVRSSVILLLPLLEIDNSDSGKKTST